MNTETGSRISTPLTRAYHSKRLPLALFLAGPALSYTLVELLNNNLPWIQFSPLQVCLNLALYYSVYYIVYLLAGRLKLAAGICSIFFYLIGAVNHYVYDFRGRTLFPADFASMGTAMNVADGYDYTPDAALVLTFVTLCVYLTTLAITPHAHGRSVPVMRVFVTISSICLAFLGLFFGTGAVDALGLEPSLWSTRGNGLILNFSLTLKCSIVDEPEGYGPETLAGLAARYPSDAVGDGQRPNIIAIMNESFSDLRALGDFETNTEVTPFLDSLMKKTLSGYAYSSIFGGTTANSEYEFLTGNATAFLPEGSVPYQLYVDERSNALPQQLKSLGYNTVAMHPYEASGWNRVPVYESFGFDEALFIDDFKDLQHMRRYVTDRSNYENLIDLFDERSKSDDPLFVFNITMQNHSAYDVRYEGLPRSAWLSEELLGAYPTADQYLSLMHESDLALEYLIDHFEKVGEPTVILLFGDHQPQVSSAFYEYMLGGELGDLGVVELQRRQVVPYFIWANFPLKEQEIRDISINYLAPTLLKAAGLPLTGYQRFLLEAMSELPVINTVGFVDARGINAASLEGLNPAQVALVERYRILEYCDIFAPEDRPEGFYKLAG